MDCFLCVSVEAGKLVGVGGCGQSSGVLRHVYERFGHVCSGSQRCTSCYRWFASIVGVCQVIHFCCLGVGGIKMYFQRQYIWGQIMTCQWPSRGMASFPQWYLCWAIVPLDTKKKKKEKKTCHIHTDKPWFCLMRALFAIETHSQPSF